MIGQKCWLGSGYFFVTHWKPNSFAYFQCTLCSFSNATVLFNSRQRTATIQNKPLKHLKRSLLLCSGKSTSKSTFSDIFSLPLVAPYEAMYLCGLAVLEFYNSILHHLTPMASTLPFLPLLLTSVYCAVGVVWSWLLFYKNFFNFGEVIFVRKPAVTTKKKKR